MSPRKDWREVFRTTLNKLANLAAFPKRGKPWSADSRVMAVRNADNSVDAEIRIIVPRGTDEATILKWLSRVTTREVILPDRTNRKSHVWMALGARYEPTTVNEDVRDQYLKHWGMLEVATYYRRTYFAPEHFVSSVDTSREMRARWARKPKEVVLRLTYEPRPGRPERKGKPAK